MKAPANRLRNSEPGSNNFDADQPSGWAECDFVSFVTSHGWRPARTMPDNPHEYTLREHSVGTVFDSAIRYIREHGLIEYFHGSPYKMLYVGEHKYWTMGAALSETTLINRKPRSADSASALAPPSEQGEDVGVTTPQQLSLEWLGPFGWPAYESELAPVPDLPGVYLMTFEYQAGYLISSAGITRRTVSARLKEHTIKYLSGVYTILEMKAIQAGARKEIWHGFWMGPRPPARVSEFEARRREIVAAAEHHVASTRVFMVTLRAKRILERIEAGIMNHLYKQQAPFCDIPDKGMHLEPRRAAEPAITLYNECRQVLHALPRQMVI